MGSNFERASQRTSARELMNVGFIDCNMRKQYHQIHTYTEKYKLKYFES
jgi:hypothetical protein